MGSYFWREGKKAIKLSEAKEYFRQLIVRKSREAFCYRCLLYEISSVGPWLRRKILDEYERTHDKWGGYINEAGRSNETYD